MPGSGPSRHGLKATVRRAGTLQGHETARKEYRQRACFEGLVAAAVNPWGLGPWGRTARGRRPGSPPRGVRVPQRLSRRDRSSLQRNARRAGPGQRSDRSPPPVRCVRRPAPVGRCRPIHGGTNQRVPNTTCTSLATRPRTREAQSSRCRRPRVGPEPGFDPIWPQPSSGRAGCAPVPGPAGLCRPRQAAARPRSAHAVGPPSHPTEPGVCTPSTTSPAGGELSGRTTSLRRNTLSGRARRRTR
jgi:hypothetical protein